MEQTDTAVVEFVETNECVETNNFDSGQRQQTQPPSYDDTVLDTNQSAQLGLTHVKYWNTKIIQC